MTTWTTILLLVAADAVLLLGELLLPAHGVLASLGMTGFFIAALLLLFVNPWAGLIAVAACVIAVPLIGPMMLRLWMKTPTGRRVVLQPDPLTPAPAAIEIGAVGTAVSELRPMGEVEFGMQRMEVISELGLLPPGTRVRVVSLNGNKPTVRKT